MKDEREIMGLSLVVHMGKITCSCCNIKIYKRCEYLLIIK